MDKPQVWGEMAIPSQPLYHGKDLTKVANHDGKISECSSSQQLLWFSAVFGLPVWGLTEIPSLKQHCSAKTVLCTRVNPSHLWLKWTFLVLTWASGCGHVQHMQIDTHRHTCAFVIMWKLERMQSRLSIYLENCTPWITDEVLWLSATMTNDCWWNNGTITAKASIYIVIIGIIIKVYSSVWRSVLEH